MDAKNCDPKEYISMRADQERKLRLELEEKYGEDIPLSNFNQIFILAGIESFANMKDVHPKAFEALVAKLRNPQFEINDELSKEIAGHGTFLIERDSVQKVGALARVIFREAEKLEGGFVGYIESHLAQRRDS